MSNRARSREFYHVKNLDFQLMKAARELVEELGSPQVSMRMVSARLGVSANAAYNHFESRAELLGCVAADALREMASSIHRQARSASKTRMVIQAAQAYFLSATSNPRIHQLVFGTEVDQSISPIEYRSALSDFHANWNRIVALQIGADDMAPSVLHKAAATWCLTHGHVLQLIHQVPVSELQAAQQMPEWMQGAIDALLSARA